MDRILKFERLLARGVVLNDLRAERFLGLLVDLVSFDEAWELHKQLACASTHCFEFVLALVSRTLVLGE